MSLRRMHNEDKVAFDDGEGGVVAPVALDDMRPAMKSKRRRRREKAVEITMSRMEEEF